MILPTTTARNGECNDVVVKCDDEIVIFLSFLSFISRRPRYNTFCLTSASLFSRGVCRRTIFALVTASPRSIDACDPSRIEKSNDGRTHIRLTPANDSDTRRETLSNFTHVLDYLILRSCRCSRWCVFAIVVNRSVVRADEAFERSGNCCCSSHVEAAPLAIRAYYR